MTEDALPQRLPTTDDTLHQKLDKIHDLAVDNKIAVNEALLIASTNKESLERHMIDDSVAIGAVHNAIDTLSKTNSEQHKTGAKRVSRIEKTLWGLITVVVVLIFAGAEAAKAVLRLFVG